MTGCESQIKDTLLGKFAEVFKTTDGVRVFFAPGRVNLIGEHVDYNGGYVLPCALSLGTYAAVRLRDDETVNFYSINFPDDSIIARNINESQAKADAGFSNYPLSVIWALKQRGYKVNKGFDIVFYGDIPNGSGLSSSASIEVLTAYICNTLFDLKISNKELAGISKLAENDFVGVACGIMDQFVIVMGKENHAVYLNTGTMDFEYVPVDLKDNSLVVACSNKKRSLIDSKYNERRKECAEALRQLNTKQKISNLCDLSPEDFEHIKDAIVDRVIAKRAKHAVYENDRTLKACNALRGGNVHEFGQLMNQSHESLKFDYEVTGIELDTLVDAAIKQEGVIGSRMTGAGFGGCTISLVANSCVERFISNVGETYKDTIGYSADFFVAGIGGGPKEI